MCGPSLYSILQKAEQTGNMRDMVTLLIKSCEVQFDDADAELLSGWRWHIHRAGTNSYVRGSKAGHKGQVYMHRLLTSAPKQFDVDHINGDGLDNRRENLRLCTRSENNANRHRIQSKTSPVKGVHFETCTGRWRAEVHWQGKRHTLGRFDHLEDAAEAYAAKAAELFGSFANPSRVVSAV